jgi:dTDP-4-amino-4,6-dideoxygalactose transaminase
LHGDLSVLSFHATKVFTTFEGGAIVSRDAKEKQRIDHLKNFGFVDDVTVVAPGINGKMSEFNAALGLLQLKHIGHAIARRREIDAMYRNLLSGITGIRCLRQPDETVSNFAYFPVLVDSDFPMSREALNRKLRNNNVYARRYFYPLISEFPMYRGFASAKRENLPVARDTALRVLCLPIYPALRDEDVQRIVACIRPER